MTRMTLHTLETLDPGDVSLRFRDLRDEADRAARRVVIGGLCAEFTNAEIHYLAEHLLNIGEVLTLRKLGLLAPDEGFDGEVSR